MLNVRQSSIETSQPRGSTVGNIADGKLLEQMIYVLDQWQQG